LVGYGARARDAHDPTAAAAVAKEGAHRAGQIAVADVAAHTGPGKRDIGAEDLAELSDLFHRYRPLQRPRRREPDEHGHVHAWQRVGERRRQGFEANAS
jgi:hypothetical protein